MDPEQRHELKESDLERFARNFGPWWQKHGTTVLLVIALALLTFIVVRYLSTRADRARENAYTAVAEASNPAALQDVARQYEDVPGLAGRALLGAADMKLQEALVGPPGAQGLSASTSESLTPEERTKSLEQASELYQRVIQRADSPLLVVNARFGLASAHESLGNFDSAREQYEKIQEQAGDSYPALVDRAGDRLENLDTIREPIEFPDPPKAAEGSNLQDLDSPHGGSMDGGVLPPELLNLPSPGESSGDGASAPQPGEMPLPQPSGEGEGDASGTPEGSEAPQPESGDAAPAPESSSDSGESETGDQAGDSSQDATEQQQQQQ